MKNEEVVAYFKVLHLFFPKVTEEMYEKSDGIATVRAKI
jgi:hypothetical protein